MSYDEPVRPRRAAVLFAAVGAIIAGALGKHPQIVAANEPPVIPFSRVAPKKPRRKVRGIAALHPREPAEMRTRTYVDSYSCPYHFGHDGRVRLGVFQQPGRETPVGENGQPLRGRARRRALRVVKVRMLKAKRRITKQEHQPA